MIFTHPSRFSVSKEPNKYELKYITLNSTPDKRLTKAPYIGGVSTAGGSWRG